MDTATPIDQELTSLRHDGWLAEITRPDPHCPQRLLPMFSEPRLDLNELIIQKPEATFLLRVQGHSMQDANIRDGDVVVVDRSITPRHGQVIIAEVNGGFTVKTLWKRGNTVKLVAANPAFKPISFPEGTELVVFGVVTWILHKAPG